MGEAFKRGDRVITPSGEVGFVDIQTDQGDVHGQYAGALSNDGLFWTMKAKVLVHWRPNEPRPKPYRAPLVATIVKGRRA